MSSRYALELDAPQARALAALFVRDAHWLSSMEHNEEFQASIDRLLGDLVALHRNGGCLELSLPEMVALLVLIRARDEEPIEPEQPTLH